MRSPALEPSNRKSAWALVLAGVVWLLCGACERGAVEAQEREALCLATEKSYAQLVSNLIERSVAEARVSYESELIELDRCRDDLASHKLKAPAQYPLTVSYATGLPEEHVSAVKAAIAEWNHRAGGTLFVDDETPESLALRPVSDDWWIPKRCDVVWVTTQSAPGEAGRTKRGDCAYTVRLHEPTAAQHELGHVLGLEHSSDPRDVMYTVHWERPLRVSEYERCLVQGALQRSYSRR